MSADWINLAWSIVAAIITALFVVGTYYVGSKTNAAVREALQEERRLGLERRVAELENTNKKHFADRDALDGALAELAEHGAKAVAMEVPSCQRASVQSRSLSRLRYGRHWEPG